MSDAIIFNPKTFKDKAENTLEINSLFKSIEPLKN